jgi:protein TonB
MRTTLIVFFLAAASAMAQQPGDPQTPVVGTPSAVRVGANVQELNLIERVEPVYPPLAMQARIQGTVRFNATIDKEGHIQKLTLVSGHPLLVQSAQQAVQQWVYRPTLLNGEPVAVITTIEVSFSL